jgi:hypothetical protein
VVNAVVAANPDAILVASTDTRGDDPAADPGQGRRDQAGVRRHTTTDNGAELAESEIASDDLEGSREAARTLAKLTGEKGSVLVINVKPGISTTDARAQGVEEELKNYPNMKSLGVEYSNRRPSTRRIVVSSGACRVPASGSRCTPRAARIGWGASAAHSPMAVRERAPAGIAAAARASILTSACRRPLRSRGSGIVASRSSRPGHSPSRRAGAPESWASTGRFGDDVAAGMDFRRDHEALRTA